MRRFNQHPTTPHYADVVRAIEHCADSTTVRAMAGIDCTRELMVRLLDHPASTFPNSARALTLMGSLTKDLMRLQMLLGRAVAEIDDPSL